MYLRLKQHQFVPVAKFAKEVRHCESKNYLLIRTDENSKVVDIHETLKMFVPRNIEEDKLLYLDLGVLNFNDDTEKVVKILLLYIKKYLGK